jgi:hypothetical protein
MTQQLTDLGKRCTLPEHLGGQGVTEQVGSFPRRVHSSSDEGALD